MDQVEAALVQVQALGQRVGADQDDVVLGREAFGCAGSFRFGVGAGDGQDGAADIRQGGGGGTLAVGVFRIDEDIGAGMFQPDQADFPLQGVQFGVVRDRGLTGSDQVCQRLCGCRCFKAGGHFLGFEGGGVVFLRGRQDAVAGDAAAPGAQGALAFATPSGGVGQGVAGGDDAQGGDAGGEGRERSFQQADEGQSVGQVLRVARRAQSRQHEVGQRFVEIAHGVRCRP